jgi:hypothetical protein
VSPQPDLAPPSPSPSDADLKAQRQSFLQKAWLRVMPMNAGVTGKRKKAALAIAAISDAVQLFAFPIFGEGAASPFDDGLDLAVAGVLAYMLGINTRLAAAFLAELVPGMSLFPTWTAFVLSLPVADGADPTAALAPPATAGAPPRGGGPPPSVPKR